MVLTTVARTQHGTDTYTDYCSTYTALRATCDTYAMHVHTLYYYVHTVQLELKLTPKYYATHTI